MRILEIIPSLKSGGAERLVTDLSIELSKSNEIEVLTLYDCNNEFYVKKLKENNIKYRNLKKKLGFDFKCFCKVFKVIKESNCDIIHCHLNSLKYVAIPAIIYKRNLIYTIHNLADKDAPGLIKYFYNILFKYFNIVPIAICKEVRKSAIKYYGDYLDKIPLIYNGINLDEIKKSKENNLIKNNKKINFLCVATFKEQKNHLYLIDLFNEINQKLENSILYLAGEGKMKKTVINYVKDIGLQDKVLFLGDRKDIYSIMKSCDIFILTSKYEGFSIAILEAMASHMKIIVSDVGGNGEQIIDNKTGVLFNLEDSNKIINNLEDIILDKDMSKRAYERVEELFNIRVISEDYFNVFKKVVEGWNIKETDR